ncbi:hypothetical protein SISSUDRAFT_1043099 [Sistotremastrum suecicum HHB10207 ss-3]|uniref:Zn(2)-C6 fungal-type domain-containing protein n=1 Tax=Sistotremastrum suecicum HHB10207 ss-3 TaxID=1314776 RepID=A0A166G333_9AGAM|nr:hypothetical protein SISSUDRAFT_1043099 [Sistotremastrum suecicum HHB10207 ss-3]
MAHLLPHQNMADMGHGPPPINPDLAMEQMQQQQMNQVPPAQPRKRKKAADGEHHGPAEPRRLRRSHEACARCRSKKIKCDSKHPRCSACAAAGVPCHQEDRHRQTLTPRGHTEKIERQLAQCEALLKRRIEGFDLNNLEEICAAEGIDADPSHLMHQFGFAPAGGPMAGPPMSPSDPKGYPYPPPPGYGSLPFPLPHLGPYGMPPNGPPYPPHMPPGFMPHIHPAFQQHMEAHPPDPERPPSSGTSVEIKGQDPQANDMSTTEALAKSFGVSSAIMDDMRLEPGNTHNDREDLAVGSGALTSGRDRNGMPDPTSVNFANWIQVTLKTGQVPKPEINIWLPRDRPMLNHIIGVYFERLNKHRPVFTRDDFVQNVSALYESRVQYEPGFICSLYIILALGTLSELSHVAAATDEIEVRPGTIPKKLLPQGWPEHTEFFDLSLVVKADLRITVSSLQALILLHWYLYTERQGRSLWRLVGHLVRLSVELGLHHDPTAQGQTFDEAECALRIRLWGIVMIHDRGTSILLGRPLAISPSDSNTPRPQRKKNASIFSDHFAYSAPIVDIQADIINSLYGPTKLNPDTIMRHARRIIKSMVEFRRQLPENYGPFFGGTQNWPLEKKIKLVAELDEDNGITMLKYWIARILLLRVLFSAKELTYAQRYSALVDAIVAAHNIIITHNQLIKFPDIAFFVSPIPIHIAAMVILYGHMSKINCLDRQTALEDVWMALDMLPRLRWRWERKDLNGEHPLIAKLAEKVFEVTLNQARPINPSILISEPEWESESNPHSPVPGNAPQPASSSNPTTPTVFSREPHYVPINHRPGPSGTSPQHNQQFPDLSPQWFYPDATFIPEKTEHSQMPGLGYLMPVHHNIGSIGCDPSNEAYLQEERDEGSNPQQMNHWVSMIEQKGLSALMSRGPNGSSMS